MFTRRRRWTRPHVDHLRQAELFGQCSPKELRLIASFVTPIHCARGRVLLREGEIGRECFVVVRGHAVVERGGVMSGYVLDGAIVGEVELLGSARRAATVTAASDMDILVMSRREFAAIRALGIRSIAATLERAVAEHRTALEQAGSGTPPPFRMQQSSRREHAANGESLVDIP
jgi:CRP-like cAMP-binding protein